MSIQNDPFRPEKQVLAHIGVWRIVLASFLCTLLAGACASGYQPMPRAIYNDKDYIEFEYLPAELQSPEFNLLYITDRLWEENAAGGASYTYKRSRTMEFGYALLDIGDEWNWDELTAWTLSGNEDARVSPPDFKGVIRKGKFPDTPPKFIDDSDGKLIYDPSWQAEFDQASANLQQEIAGLLAMAPVKEIVLSVHGIDNQFEDWAKSLGLWWHMGGRQRVPVNYSWPAGKKGVLTFYSYDRESGEFTTFHLKQALRVIAEMPEVEGIHILGHSRGTDVALTALRELILVERAAGNDPRQTLKLKNLVLLAADLDFEVVGQRAGAEGLWTAFEHVTIYATGEDSALSKAQSMFGSSWRLGQARPEDIPDYFQQAVWAERNVDFVFYEGDFKGRDITSHSYYLSPSVGADLIMLIRGNPPGAEHGRPLKEIGSHMYVIEKDYLR